MDCASYIQNKYKTLKGFAKSRHAPLSLPIFLISNDFRYVLCGKLGQLLILETIATKSYSILCMPVLGQV